MSHDEHLPEDDPILARARRLDTAIAPSRDLWPEIASRMRAQQSPRFSASWLALAAIVLVSVSSTVTLWLDDRFTSAPADSAADAGMLVAASVAPVSLGPEYAQNRIDLVLSLEQELAQLSPPSREIMLTNLRDIDDAVAEIRIALQHNPNSELLLHLLLSAYTDQLTMLSKIDGMTRTINQGTEL